MNSTTKIYASTHAELLNKLLGKQYSKYMQCRYDLHNGYKIWMIKLDGKMTKDGWTNSITDFGHTVTEEYTGNPYTKLPTHEIIPHEKRLVFGVYGTSSYDRYYVFYGAFSPDKANTANKRIWHKISDSYDF